MRNKERESNFSRKTIDALAKRAAYTCSCCKISTLCAAECSGSEHAHTGQVAHIVAASPNGPRGSKSVASEEKTDISNGIYLCAICHRLVDANRGKDYPPERLRKMKEDHEKSTRQKVTPFNLNTLKIQSNINALEEDESLENLIACFTESSAKKIIEDISDPRMQRHMMHYNGPGKIKWLDEKFRKVPLAKGDTRANTFIRVKRESLDSLDVFIKDRDMNKFREKWNLYHKELFSLKGY